MKIVKSRMLCATSLLGGLIIPFVLIACVGCVSNNKKAKEAEILMSLNATQTALVDTAFFQSVAVIPLEANDSSLIRSVDRIYRMDSVYYLFDYSLCKVFMYNEQGNYLGQINDRANGPAEYVQVSDMAIDRKRRQIVLLCDRPYKVMYYTLDGKFLKEAAYSDYYNEFAVDGDCIYCYKKGEHGDDGLLTYTYPFEMQREELLPERVFFQSKAAGVSYVFHEGSNLTLSDAVYLTRPFENMIYIVNEDGVYGKYGIDFKNHNLPSSLLEENSPAEKFLNVCDENKYVCGINSVVGNCDYLLFRTNIGLCIYDKQLQQLNGYDMILNTTLRSGTSKYLPVGNTDCIVQVVQAMPFKMWMGIKHKKEPGSISPAYEKVYQQIQDEDNPVLIVYELPCKS